MRAAPTPCFTPQAWTAPAALRSVVLLLALAQGCGAAERPASERPEGYGALAAALRACGAAVSVGGELSEAAFMPVPARLLTVDGASVHVFDLPSAQAAERQARGIAPDASVVGHHAVAWLAAPHFYRSGRSIVLYLGDDSRVLGHLRQVLGPPIARGAARPAKRRSGPVEDGVPTTRV